MCASYQANGGPAHSSPRTGSQPWAGFIVGPRNVPGVRRERRWTIDGPAGQRARPFRAHAPRPCKYSLLGKKKLDGDSFMTVGRRFSIAEEVESRDGYRLQRTKPSCGCLPRWARDLEIPYGPCQAARSSTRYASDTKPIGARHPVPMPVIHLMNLDAKNNGLPVTTGTVGPTEIPSIPVHDQRLLSRPQFSGPQAKAKMAESWERFCGKVNPCRIK